MRYSTRMCFCVFAKSHCIALLRMLSQIRMRSNTKLMQWRNWCQYEAGQIMVNVKNVSISVKNPYFYGKSWIPKMNAPISRHLTTNINIFHCSLFWSKNWFYTVRPVVKWHHPHLEQLPKNLDFAILCDLPPGWIFPGKNKGLITTQRRSICHCSTKTGWALLSPVPWYQWNNWNNCEILNQLMGKAKKVKRESGWKKSERTDIRLTERASGVMW